MKFKYSTAIKNLLPQGAMVSSHEDYNSIIVEDGLKKPSLVDVENEIRRMERVVRERQAEYPTPEEWIVALVQKELDNDESLWNELTIRRQVVKNKYRVSVHQTNI